MEGAGQPSLVPAAGEVNRDEPIIDLRDLLRLLNHYKWGIASVTVVVTLIAAFLAFSMPPVYRATVTVLVEAKTNEPLTQVEDVYDPGVGRVEYYGTQFEIIKSRELAKRVIQKLNLTEHAEFKPRPPRVKLALDWRQWLPFLKAPEGKPMSDAERAARQLEALVDDFSSRLSIEHVWGTQLVKAHFEAKDPKLAALVANTLAEIFIESSLEGRLETTQKASSWLTDKLGSIKADLQRAEQALQAFREQEQLVYVGGERGLVEQEMTDNAQRLREARKARAELASTYAQIEQARNDPKKLEDVSALLQDALVDTAKGTMLKARQDVKALEQRYGPKHPSMIAARASLNEATVAYETQLLTAAKGAKAQYEVARDNERALSQFEQTARGALRGLDRKQYQLRALERDVETNRQLYDMFLTRFKETDLTGSYEALTARVVDPAVEPRFPHRPKKRRIVFLAMIGGVVLGLLLAAALALLSDVVRSADELESVTRLPILTVLPKVTGARVVRGLFDSITAEPKSGFSEGIRSLRTSVVLSDLNSKRKRIVVTSSVPEEGKTTISINLAVALGQIEKTLLIEGDLRRPSIASKFNLSNKHPGLTDLLSGAAPLENCMYRYEAGNIDILPVGRLPPNPAEILASGKFRQVLDAISSRYERIIIDSAPCHAVSDTYLLAQQCDGLIFLVNIGVARSRMIRGAVSHLRNARAPLIGTVVNSVDLRRHGQYFASYYYDYGYYT